MSIDPHKRSPLILLVSIFISCVITLYILTLPVRVNISSGITPEKPSVIIHLQNIPETRQTVTLPAPPRPFIPSGTPMEMDELQPDDVTIEDTVLESDTLPAGPPPITMPQVEVARTENQVYEYFEVEEIPRRLENILPDYPEMARRAGINGTVTLKVLVNEKGIVDSVEVIDGPSIFRKSAVEAAKMTKFSPAKYNDRVVACWVVMPYKFVLK